MNKLKLNYLIIIFLCPLLNWGLTFGSASPSPTNIKASGSIEVAFSPNNGATSTIVKAINSAHKEILVSAYSFTSREISYALVKAKARGISVRMILDKSQVRQKYSSATFFNNQDFDLHIDIKHAIYHDKVMVIDGVTVVTGSFNFTQAAETKNAENVLVLYDNPQLAKLYTADWLYNWSISVPYKTYIQNATYQTSGKQHNADYE